MDRGRAIVVLLLGLAVGTTKGLDDPELFAATPSTDVEAVLKLSLLLHTILGEVGCVWTELSGDNGRVDIDAGVIGRADIEAGVSGRADIDAGVIGRAPIDAGVKGRPDNEAGVKGLVEAGVSGRVDAVAEKNESEDVSLLDVVAVVPSEADEIETSICGGAGTWPDEDEDENGLGLSNTTWSSRCS